MHDHDDPKRCTLCSHAMREMHSYAELLNFKPGGSINATVQQFLDAYDWSTAVGEAVTA